MGSGASPPGESNITRWELLESTARRHSFTP